MPEFKHLLATACKAERRAGRRLAARDGLSQEDGLRRAMQDAAAPRPLATLVLERRAAQAAQAQRTLERRQGQAAALALKQARHAGSATPWRAWFDGSAYPNPGRCGIGGLLRGPQGEHVEISEAAGSGNSSEAEYRALIAVLHVALLHKSTALTVYGDSQVVIGDVTGGDGAAAPSLAQYRTAARALIAQLPQLTLRWIPRHRNAEADALSQRARRD